MASQVRRTGQRLDGSAGFRLDGRPEPLRVWLSGMWRYRGVLMALARKDFKIRYKRTMLGALWAVAVPLLQAIVMVFIFSRVGRFGSGTTFSYAGFVLAGMVPWVYTSTTVLSSTTSIVDGASLTDKVWFPRALLALVPPVANLVTLGVSALILVPALVVVGEPPTLEFLLIVPAILLAVLFVSAAGLLLSALQVYFRDVKFMVQAVMLVWLYVTPIVYPQTALGSAGKWLDYNPLTGVVGLFQRAAVGAPVPSGTAIAVSITATVLLTVSAVAVHRRHDRLFVDLL